MSEKRFEIIGEKYIGHMQGNAFVISNTDGFCIFIKEAGKEKTKDSWLLQKEIVELKEENKELKKENEELNISINLFEADIIEKDNKIKQLQQQLDFIQNNISNAIKHQKTELEQKALKRVISDYNDFLLGHNGEYE